MVGFSGVVLSLVWLIEAFVLVFAFGCVEFVFCEVLSLLSSRVDTEVSFVLEVDIVG